MVYYIENEILKIGVKSFGAELTSVVSKKSGEEYLWQGNPEIWSGQSPILFPVIGRLLGDSYTFRSREYSMMKHGFFRRRESGLVSREKSKIEFMQTEDSETEKIYPFKFEVHIIFELIGSAVRVTHTVINKNNDKMYFSIGAHPAFNCALGDKLIFDEKENLDTVSIDGESLRIPGSSPVLRNDDTITVTKDIFNNDALILSGIKSKHITLADGNNNKRIRFDFGSSPYLGIWAKPGAPYVCIEPWWGINDSHEKKDDFSQKDAIIALEKNKTFSFYWQAEI